MMADELLNAQDLITAKKHDTFHSEVITGKTGGLSTGANIDYATNAVTGQTQTTLPKLLSNVGFSPAGFDFTTGGTLTERDKAIFYQADGNWYSWGGTLPKVVPPASSPASTGGIADNAWNVSTSAFMYRDWGGFTAELLAQAGIVDDGQPDSIGDSQRVEAIKAISTRSFSSVSEMLERFPRSMRNTGDIVGSGGTTWKVVDPDATDISGFIPVGDVCVDDFLGAGLNHTESISSALSFGVNCYLLPVAGRVLIVDGGVLYLREGQELNANFNTLKLKDDYPNLSSISGSVIEMSSRSRLLNARIDGSASFYKSMLDAVTDFDSTPFSHGVYTSRLSTNGGVYAPSSDARLDRVLVTNTIRSCIVITGINVSFGELWLSDSYCDHWLYFITCTNPVGGVAHCSGTFREEGVVFDGREASKANGVKVARLNITAPKLTAYPYRNVFFRLLHARDCDTSEYGKSNFEIGSINVSSYDLSTNLANLRNIKLGYLWRCRIGEINFSAAIAPNHTPILESAASFVCISSLAFNIESAGGNLGGLNIVNAFKSGSVASSLNIESMLFESQATFDNTSFMIRNSGADINIGYLKISASGLKFFKLYSTTDEISLSIDRLYSTSPNASAFELAGINPKYFLLGSSNITTSTTSGSPSVGANKTVFLTGSQSVANFSDTCNGMRFFVVGNGSASIANNSVIKTKSGATLTLENGKAAEFIFINGVYSEI